MFPSSTDSPSVREPCVDGNISPVVQVWNDVYSTNSQEILILVDNIRPEDTGYQSVTSPILEALGGNFHLRHSDFIKKYPQWYDPVFGSAI